MEVELEKSEEVADPWVIAVAVHHLPPELPLIMLGLVFNILQPRVELVPLSPHGLLQKPSGHGCRSVVGCYAVMMAQGKEGFSRRPLARAFCGNNL